MTTAIDFDELQAAADRGLAISYHAAAEPHRPALLDGSSTVRTFGELDRRANQLARALRRRGLAAGDAVALLCANRAEFVEVLAATQRAGLRLTPVNWHLTGDEVGYIVADCEADAFVADARFASVAAVAAAAAPDAQVRVSIGGPIDGFEPYEGALAAEPGDGLADPSLGWSMLYTSGTTGRPKGVHRNQAPVSAKLAAGMAGYRPGDVHLCTGPLYHAAPLLFSMSVPLLVGVPVVLTDGWDARRCLRLIEEQRVTHTHMVPTMFHRLLALPDDVRMGADISSLRYVIHGAAPCPVPVKRRLIEWIGPVVHEYYAATEGLGTFVDSETWLSKPGTVGKPWPDDQVYVGDEESRRLPPGEIGLVWLKAATIDRFEYFKDDAKTASTYRGEHFTLGDVGYLDADGYLFLTDRSANVIISGGVNIYPAEIDAVLLEHPAVGDVATIGIPDEEWGEAVLAVVEPGDGHVASTELGNELLAFCRQRLAGFKCPRRVDFVAELPRQDNGKIYKRILRDRYRTAPGPTGKA
ncbi:MAG TPA: AMP-binding protein [Acidimicrobiia bacterium]